MDVERVGGLVICGEVCSDRGSLWLFARRALFIVSLEAWCWREMASSAAFAVVPVHLAMSVGVAARKADVSSARRYWCSGKIPTLISLAAPNHVECCLSGGVARW